VQGQLGLNLLKARVISQDSLNSQAHLPQEGVFLEGTNYPSSQSVADWAKDIYGLTPRVDQMVQHVGEPNVQTYSWGFFLLSLLGVVILAIVIAFYRRRFDLLLGVLLNWKLSKQIIRYEKVHSHPVNLLLMLAFILFFPLFFAKVGSELSHYTFTFLWQQILLYLLIYVGVKLLLYRFSAWLLDEGDLINKYVFQLNLFSKFMGVLLIGLWILLIYSPISTSYLYGVSLLILAIFLTLQTVRAIIIGRSEGKNLYLIILYLCALEIVPWFLVIKSLKNNW